MPEKGFQEGRTLNLVAKERHGVVAEDARLLSGSEER